MRTYRRIAYEDRCQMYALRKAGKTQIEIGQALGVSQGTVSRELSRNTGRRGKCYNRRGAQHAGRGVIPHRIDIAERPLIVASKSRLGDWEGDTIVGAQHKGALLTQVERKSLFTTISKLPRPTATAAHRATVHRLNPYAPMSIRSRQRVCQTPENRPYSTRPGLLCHALSRVGTRCERKHERPHPGLLS